MLKVYCVTAGLNFLDVGLPAGALQSESAEPAEGSETSETNPTGETEQSSNSVESRQARRLVLLCLDPPRTIH